MDPLDAVFPRRLDRTQNQTSADAATTIIRMYRSVDQESVYTPIPRQIDEANQLLFVVRTNVGQAVPENGVEVAPRWLIPSHGEQRLQSL